MKLKTAGKIAVGAGMLSVKAYGIVKLIQKRSLYSFQDRVVLITGGSRGLGLVLARQLVSEGAQVAITARDGAELERAADDLRARGGTVLTVRGDVGVREDAEEAVHRTVERFGRLDVLLNVAGIIQTGPYEHMNISDFEDAMAVHFWGPLYTMRAALPYLSKQKGARIVNIASFGGKVPVPHLIPYCASKFALVGLSSGLRSELAAQGITVTTVCPGLMRTGSHLHALFKGKHEQEYFWFALGASTPFFSMNAERAARQILEACRRGQAELVVGRHFKLVVRLIPLMPELAAKMLALFSRLMPGPTGPEGDESLPGWACRSLTPSLLTLLADRAAEANNELMHTEQLARAV